MISWAFFYGGATGTRTPDLLRAKQALSQLSYCPKNKSCVVGVGGLEPPTSILSGSRSNQLSYTPVTSQRGKV